MKSTRNRILEIMETRQRIGSQELARLTHVTPANIRHHLRQLAAEGLIRKTGENLVEGRGRPTPLYTLVHPRSNITGLAGHLLDMLDMLDGEEALRALAKAFSPQQADFRRHITQRLVNAMRRLEQLNYLPRWEALPNGPEVILGHCPFSDIIADHPELCRMDALLLERLLGTSVAQIEKLARNDEGTVICRFSSHTHR